MSEDIHASAVALGERGVLLRGVAGVGKSDLALRLIDRGALLVADDRVLLTRESDGVRAAPPQRLAGWISVAGVGPLPLPHRPSAALALIVDLVPDAPRHPLDRPDEPLLGVLLRRICLDPRAASAPLVIEHVLAAGARNAPLAD